MKYVITGYKDFMVENLNFHSKGIFNEILYHGSHWDFDEFDENKIGRTTDAGWYSKGFYFTNTPEQASYYGNYVYKCNITLNNPLYTKASNKYNFRKELNLSDDTTPEEITKSLIAKGFDGVVVLNPISNNISECVVYNTESIKIIESRLITENKGFLMEDLVYRGEDKMNKEEVFFHGTSLKQWKRIVGSEFNVQDFYMGDSEDNIARNYAEIQSLKDDTDGVIIVLNSELLDGEMVDDRHGEDRQIGQYIFNGNIRKAIHTVKNINTGSIILTYEDL